MSTFVNWNDTIDNLHELGRNILDYEESVVNLIASDNAYPKALSKNPAYTGHIIQEGLVWKRPFAGARLHDIVEQEAIKIACSVFGVEHANLQPHSCSQANQAVFQALLSPGDIVLSLDFRAGGHLTHGLKANFSGRHFRFIHYGLTEEGGIAYDTVRNLAIEHRPRLIICGSSSYPRIFDANCLKEIAKSVGAKLMFDLSHEAGLIAGGVYPNITGIADVVTMSTDKTLRGPFGGIILCKKSLAQDIDKGVHPGTQSSFPIRKVVNTAEALASTQLPNFRIYAKSVLANAKVFENHFGKDTLFTGGTDKHYVVLDVKEAFGLTGLEAERRLEMVDILSNRQLIPTDTSNKMSDANGIRLGTAWATSRGFNTTDFSELAKIISDVLSEKNFETKRDLLKRQVSNLVVRVRELDVW